MEVLFTLVAARYERGSVLIMSNLPYSKWEMIFKDPMTTAAAIYAAICVTMSLKRFSGLRPTISWWFGRTLGRYNVVF